MSSKNQIVFNCDKTAFFSNPKQGKALAPKGCKSVYNASGNDEKFNITILITSNANGKLAPPLVVYRHTRIPQAITESIPSDRAIVKFKKGWVTQELSLNTLQIFSTHDLKRKIFQNQL